jgi:DHA3 family macrolide efflux protein-like MFS transporter
MSKRTISWNPEKWIPLFVSIWGGQTLSWVGSAVAQFSLVWWLTEKTGSATILAVGTLISMLPGVILGPLVGALVDRWNRRHVILVADSMIALVSLWLAYIFWSDTIQIWHVYTIMFIRALGGAFHWPANQASISLMVPKEQLPRISGLNQMVGGAVNIVAPPLGALLLQVLEIHWIMMIDVTTALFSILPMLIIIIPQPETTLDALEGATLTQTVKTIWGDIKAGFLYIWNWKGIFWLLMIAMLINFFVNPAMSLVPILVTRHFNGDALELGWLNASWGIGMLVGGFLLGAWGGFKKRIHTVLIGIIGLGLGILLVGFAPDNLLLLAIVGFFIGSAMNAITNGTAFAILQTLVAPDMQGRVFTVVMSMAGAISPLSLAIGGPVADWLGVRVIYFIAGISLVILGVVGFMIPSVLNIEAGVSNSNNA